MAGPVGDGIVEGFIDLLFEEDDGYVIVDYKTDNRRLRRRDRTGDGCGIVCKVGPTRSL